MLIETLLRAQGACATSERSGWRLGWWLLDAAALRFETPHGRPIATVRLARMLGAEMGRRKFLVTSKPVLIVSYSLPSSEEKRRCWLLTADVGIWQRELRARAPRRRFALDVSVETHVEPNEVVVMADLSTGFRDDPPSVHRTTDGRGVVLSTVDGQTRGITLPVAAAEILDVEVSETGMMVVRLRRVTTTEERTGHG